VESAVTAVELTSVLAVQGRVGISNENFNRYPNCLSYIRGMRDLGISMA
jgi:hypothetical protein